MPASDLLLAHVKAAAALQSLPLSDERASAVAVHLGRTLAMARLLESAPLTHAHELAEIYRPAPFPSQTACASASAAQSAPAPLATAKESA